MLPIFVGRGDGAKRFGGCPMLDGPYRAVPLPALPTVPLLFPLLGTHKLWRMPRNKMLSLSQRVFFFVTKDLDAVLVLPGQAPADFDSVSLFFFPHGLASVLDEGWTCADLHLSQAGLDQQDLTTR